VFVFTPEASAPVATTTSLTPSSTHATSGQAITFTAAVAPKSGSGVPAGTVAFSDGSTQIGTASLNSSGSTAFDTSSLANGSHSISAAYFGDTNFAASKSAAVSITISAPAKIATTTSVSASATQLTPGQNVTFTAAVAPQTGTGVPTGSVTFLDGQIQLGAVTLNGGAASFGTATLAAGTHTVTTAYSGDSNYAASTSAAVTVTVTTAAAADYSLTMSSSSLTVAQGSSGSLMLTVTPKNGFKQAVGFSCSGLPTGAGCTFNPQAVAPVAGAVSTTLTVQLPAAAGTTAPPSMLSPGFQTAGLYFLFLTILGIMGATQIKRSATQDIKLARAFLATAVFAALLATANCAGYSGQKTGQPASTYTVTVTASDANAPTHTQQFTLTVMP
jgi:Bacterial Ig-like domain (group 3)